MIDKFLYIDGFGRPTSSPEGGASNGAVIYKGSWDATTNIITSLDSGLNGLPIPAAILDNQGYYFTISVAGSTNIDGISDWAVTDLIISNGITWSKCDNTDKVNSVFSRTGAVTATAGDYNDTLITAADYASFNGFTNTVGGLKVYVVDKIDEFQSDYYTAGVPKVTDILSDISTLQADVIDVATDLTTLDSNLQGQINLKAPITNANLITPTLGAALATSVNGKTIPVGAGTLASTTDLTTLQNTLQANIDLKGNITGQTFVTPTLGVALATSVNGKTIPVGAGTVISDSDVNTVSNGLLAQINSGIFKARLTGGTGNVENVTATQVTTLLDLFTDVLKGLVPASGGGTANFLRADGTFASPTASIVVTEAEIDFGTDRQVLSNVTLGANTVSTHSSTPFLASDVGKYINGIGIPDNTIITVFNSDTNVTIDNIVTRTKTHVTTVIIDEPRIRIYDKTRKYKNFTITDGAVSSGSKLIVTSSGNLSTGRGTDNEAEIIDYTVKPGTGNFVLTAKSSNYLKGKRKILYTIA